MHMTVSKFSCRIFETLAVFLLRQLWIVNYYIKSSSNNLSNENINTVVSVVFKTKHELKCQNELFLKYHFSGNISAVIMFSLLRLNKFGPWNDMHPIYRLRLPKKYKCISVGKSIIGNELPTEFGNAGTQVLVTLSVVKAFQQRKIGRPHSFGS